MRCLPPGDFRHLCQTRFKASCRARESSSWIEFPGIGFISFEPLLRLSWRSRLGPSNRNQAGNVHGAAMFCLRSTKLAFVPVARLTGKVARASPRVQLSARTFADCWNKKASESMVATKVRLVELPGSLRFQTESSSTMPPSLQALTRTTFWQSTMARNKANTWSPVVVALFTGSPSLICFRKRSMSSATGN